MAEGHYFTRDMPMSDIMAPGDNLGARMNKGMAIAKFYVHTVQDVARTAATGAYRGRPVDMVRIIIPGDKHNIVERRVKESDKEKYAREYEAFRKMEDYQPDGTLLQNWPLLSRSQVEDLKYSNIFTVEQLSEVPDNMLSSLGLGGRLLRKHAKAFLETAATGAVSSKLVSENAHLQSTVDQLTKQISDLTSKFEAMAGKAGQDVAELSNPIIEAAAEAVEVARNKPKVIPIPDDYKTMSLPALKSLCREFTETPVVNKASAFELIEEYQAVA